MRFEHTFESSVPAEPLFSAHRDELPNFGYKLPGVARIEASDRREEGPRAQLHHCWQGDTKILPAALRLFVPARLFRWEDHSEWDGETLTGRWRVSVPALGDMVRIEGTHHFEPGPRTKVTVKGELQVALIETLGGQRSNAFLEKLLTSVLNASQAVIEAHINNKPSS